jgi:hypothetical protein
MGCDTKVLSLDYLRDNKSIDETRIIIDANKFNRSNRYVTAIAVEKYGLDVGDKMLFSVVSSKYKGFEQNWALANDVEVVRALPSEELFEKLDELHKIKTKEKDDQIMDVLNRTPVNRVLNVGYRHKDTGVSHFTETNSDSPSYKDRKAQVSNDGYLNEKTDANLYDSLVKEFKRKNGYQYNVNKASFSEQDSQKKFYDFLMKEGLEGIEVYNSRGEMEMFSFGQPEVVEVEQEPMLKLKEDVVEEELITEDPKTKLETELGYVSAEAHEILETYSLEQVNDMISKDKANALEIFDKLLYGEQLKTDIFATDQQVKEQINKCK